MDIEKIHKLREQCLVRFPLRINQYNHYIEDANGCVIAVVYGTAGNAAPYLVEAANALPELLEEVEMLRKALHLACTMIGAKNNIFECPVDIYKGIDGCFIDDCHMVEFWVKRCEELEKQRSELISALDTIRKMAEDERGYIPEDESEDFLTDLWYKARNPVLKVRGEVE